jgi:Sulfotransferase family
LLESRVIWIWGSPRSGSSWLLKLLSHPAKVDMHAPLGFEPTAGGSPLDVLPIDELSFASHLAPWDGQPVAVFDEWLPGTVLNFSEARPTYLFSSSYRDVWQPRMRDLLLARLDAVAERAASVGVAVADPTIVIKETPTSHGADRVMDLVPGSRAIVLIRDPRDVVDSLLSAFRPGGFMAEQFGVSYSGASRIDGVRWASRQWAMSIDVAMHALDAHDPDLGMTVRYEDLIADTASELAAILSWAGLERSASQIAQAVEDSAFGSLPDDEVGELKRDRKALPGSWRENLSEPELEAILETVGDRLERFGYGA